MIDISTLLEPAPKRIARRLGDHRDFCRNFVSRAIARAFTPPPAMPIWEWADTNVLLHNEDAAEPGHYRSAKTPWTRRLQELMQTREMFVWSQADARWERIALHEISVMKSSQSGYSEACLNGVRWRAMYRPCNVIYAIDSAEEARKIANRLLRSLQALDRGIFTGDPDDIKSLWFKLRGMDVLFYGSFSSGKFANKQAPLLIADEVEEHKQVKGDTTSLTNLSSRKKTSSGGLQLNLSKPKLKGGPIHTAFEEGNREECYVPCPHCQHRQPLTFFPEETDSPFSEELIEIKDEQTGAVIATLPKPLPPGERRKVTTGRVVFEHCKDLLSTWDKVRILRETYYECGSCKGRIDERDHKRWMLDRMRWLPTSLDGTPGIVSQHINDLYSEDELSTWGEIVLHYLKAKAAGFEALQGFYNHRLGKVWSEERNTLSEKDILANIAGRPLWLVDAPDSAGHMRRHIFHSEADAEKFTGIHIGRSAPPVITHSACPPYKRGTLPWSPLLSQGRGALILGSDVGGNYAKWIVCAVAANARDVAVIDWGTEIGPHEISHIAQTLHWPGPDGKAHRILKGFIDCHYRTEDVYASCIASRGLLIPAAGVGGVVAKSIRLYNYSQIAHLARTRLHKLDFNAQRGKDATYRDRLKYMRTRCWFPVDVGEDKEFVEELCAEHQVEIRGQLVWPDEPLGPNHYGDALVNAIVGLNYMTRPVAAPGPAPAATPAI